MLFSNTMETGMGKRVVKVSTSVLWKNLFKTTSARKYLEDNESELGLDSLTEFMCRLCRERGEAPERVIKRAGVERAFGHQIFRGIRKPSRDTVLQLAFGFEMNVEQAQDFLLHSGHRALYPRIQRDAAICYCLEKRFSIIETQQTLEGLALPIIGDVKR